MWPTIINYFKTITGGFLAIIYRKKSNYNVTQGKGIRLIVKVSCINRDTHFHTKHAQSYIQTKDIDSRKCVDFLSYEQGSLLL